MVQFYQNPNPNGRSLVDCPKCKKRVEHHAKGHCGPCYRKYLWAKRTIVCKNCGRERKHGGYGLCKSCHSRIHRYYLTKAHNIKKHYGIDYEVYKEITKRCMACGFDKIVEIHHLDGNKKNNSSENIAGLCPNCHKLIHTHQYFEEVKKKLKDHGFDVSKIKPAYPDEQYFKKN